MKPEWIAVDWGTSACRAWAIGSTGVVLAETRSDQGMGGLSGDAFEGVLKAMIAPWGTPSAPIVACGMVGSRQGWAEAPYTVVPCAPEGLSRVEAPAIDTELSVTLIGGIKQESPADVMRGEETQIAGFLAQSPNFEGVLCLPGTHTKWVHVASGEIVSFRTAMTGELFGLLSTESVLRHAMGIGWERGVFETAIDDALARPEALAARLFGVRAESLLNGMSGGAARSRVSGLLIGAELAAMRPYWLGQNVAVIGETRLAAIYADALALQGLVPGIAAGDEMTRAGLARLRRHLESTG
ncbi:MAG: 2-dehydro-3-deoxygalactonokinase [Pseudomonadota bacterium]